MKRLLLVPAGLVPALLVILSAPALSQPAGAEVWARVGLFGGMNINIHSASFGELPGVPNCCPEFTSGDGIGGAVGLLYEQILGGPLEIALRAGFEGRGATLETSEPFPVIVDGNEYDGEIRHVLETSLPVVMIEPLLGLRFGSARAQLGPRFGIVTGGTFEQREELARPEEIGTFENRRRVRNEASGAIPGVGSFDAGLTLGLSYDIALDRERTMLASPEVMFTADLTSVTSDLSWRAHALRLGVALRYQLMRASTPVDVPLAADTLGRPIVTRPASAAIRALGVGIDGGERSDISVNVEEFISTNMRPLLNYLFFDEATATLPERYERADAARFEAGRLHSLDAIGTYHHLLNIVGQRLRAMPAARVTLVGCNAASLADTGMGLSRARALAVREYLRSTWGIDTSRMRIETRALPSKPSDSSTADGRAENRRVEILSDEPALLTPVVTLDTLRSVTPPLIRFRVSATGIEPPADWRIEVAQHGSVIRSFDGVEPLPAAIDWNTNADQLAVPSAGDSLHYALRVIGRGGVEARAEGALAVNVVTLRRKREERIGDRVIDRYSLILFDFDRATIEGLNAKIVEDIRARIAPGATVSVTGSTDRIGEEAYNERLSQERARNVARLLGVAPERVAGVGESNPPYDNDLPEGRFYSRTVTIVVETPVEAVR